MDQKLIDLLNEQLSHELQNWVIYKNFSGIADYQGLVGAVSWFDKQALEEYAHFNAFFTLLSDLGYIPEIAPFNLQSHEKKSLLEMFKEAVEVEAGTTAILQRLYNLAIMLNEGRVAEFVLKYLKEQVEEEKTVQDIVARLELAGESYGVILIDNELAKR